MSKSFDPTKPVRTRDGRPARILCTEAGGLADGFCFSIVAMVDGHIGLYAADGTYYSDGLEGRDDLVNVPERVVRFYAVPHSAGEVGHPRKSFESAVASVGAYTGSLTVLRITYEDGAPIEVELTYGED